MKTLRIPLVGSYTNRNFNPGSFSSTDQQFINCYPEVVSNPLTQKATAYLYKRPGSIPGSALTGVGAACSSGAIVAWTGSGNSTPPVAAAFLHTSSTSTGVFDLVTNSQIGAFIPATNDCSALAEAAVNSVAHLVGNFYDTASGALEQWYFPEGGAWAQITSACLTSATASTSIVGFPAQMDGFMFNMMSDGKIRNSDINTVSSYQPANFVEANDYPDKGVTVARIGNYIVGFGEKTIQPFYNAGNAAGSVLARVQGGTIHMGAARKANNGLAGVAMLQTVLVAHGTIFWIGTNSEGATTGVYRFDGLKPAKVSTPAIDKLLMTSGIIGFIGSQVLHGQRIISMRGSSGVWNYDLDTNYWWKETLAAGEIRACLGVGTLISPPNGVTYFTGTINSRGNLRGASVTYQDSSSTYTMTVQTANMNEGTNRKKVYHRLDMAYDRQASTSPVTISASDNDFVSYTTLGTIDTVSSNPQSWIARLGAARRRSWKFEHSANTPFRAEAVEIKYTESDT